jgi:hypothetical protein
MDQRRQSRSDHEHTSTRIKTATPPENCTTTKTMVQCAIQETIDTVKAIADLRK